MSNEAHEIYEKAYKLWNPDKVETFRSYGVELSMGEREGSYFKDLDDNQYINMHSNGGVFNLGHRNPEIREAIIKGVELVDAGNHYYPSKYKNELCEKILDASPDNMKYVFMLSGGGEANDAAIKFARKATGRTRVIALECAFHGATGIAMQAGNPDMAAFFNMKPDEEEYTHVPYNDLGAIEEVLKKNDTACVIIETIPATAGFPTPIDGYHKSIEELSHKYGALYIADEVQTGLMRSGEMWCACKLGATPDIIVSGKGLSGGYYPMSAVIMNENAGGWLKEDGFAHVSSFNASEIGCIVSSKAMEIMTRDSTKENVDMLTNFFAAELSKIQSKYPQFLSEIRQCGVIMGLKTSHPMGGPALMKGLMNNGVWSVMANFDKSVLQFKPGLLMKKETAEEVIKRLDKAIEETLAMFS
ncbi:MAG: aminotransferase class III-fold pyridoxal phosphate-dependent enzyme [Spirochaetales bacterium]|nr:aminotransferase class III-fold pyridoxal phosphate-dependent enzyme [Spirochaetales bacterium]